MLSNNHSVATLYSRSFSGASAVCHSLPPSLPPLQLGKKRSVNAASKRVDDRCDMLTKASPIYLYVDVGFQAKHVGVALQSRRTSCSQRQQSRDSGVGRSPVPAFFLLYVPGLFYYLRQRVCFITRYLSAFRSFRLSVSNFA